MKQIPLTQGKFALVDDQDYDYLNQWKWYHSKAGYAATNKPYANKRAVGALYMHTLIMNTVAGTEVDHRDGNALNNQRENLRQCTHAQNIQNRSKLKNNTSGYKGLVYDKGRNKWQANIVANKIRYHLGRFKCPTAAAIAYDKGALRLHGQYARLNILSVS